MYSFQNNFLRIALLTLIVSYLCFPGVSFAHQPRISEGIQTNVTHPEISKAYYAELKGAPQTYTISSDESFPLYINILVPDILGQKKDISVKVIKDGDTQKPFAMLDGSTFEWTQFFEPFGYDTYLMGPEYKGNVKAGKYDIIVSSSHSDIKYSLAIGEAEVFDFQEIMNALSLVPQIKRDFFDESPASFIFSPFGFGLIFIMFSLSFVFGFTYRWFLGKYAHNTLRKSENNIGRGDRLIRLIIGCILFIVAITTSWSPILLFFAGFCFFEAIFSWCGLYAALGKSTCPWSANV